MKKIMIIALLWMILDCIPVYAITSGEVTYNKNGLEENLTETLDTLYRELNEYKTGGSVTASEMLEGSSGYSKGVLVNGSIKRKGATTYTPGVNDITISKGQYLNENQVIKGDSNLKPENIKSGVSIFGINGTAPKVTTFFINYFTDNYEFWFDNHKSAFSYRISIRENYPNYRNISRENIYIDISNARIIVYSNQKADYYGDNLTTDYDNTTGEIVLTGAYSNFEDKEYGVSLHPNAYIGIKVAIIE